ncbi:hypothetical protein BCR43DRAFT_499349 [Syncephalastrum racemosum]|uniref:F-box domain-containing protein n=1 Tax=Syncephalastrum racemosum TaxID=13706 RepID=A0A1X2H0F1_SYNRA|nr:hypothetical protein BCR43DRAFT_499349 [Syncephalastrum racemosum]
MSADPFLILPPELMQLVFSDLSEERLEGLRVSRTWRNTLLSLPLWDTLLLKTCQGSDEAFNLPYLRSELRHLELTLDSSVEYALDLLLRHNCTQVEDAHVISFSELPRLPCTDPISVMTRIQMLSNDLTSLHVGMCWIFDVSLLRFILNACPNLLFLEKDEFVMWDSAMHGRTMYLPGIPDDTPQHPLHYLRWPAVDGIFRPNFIPAICPELKGLCIHSFNVDETEDTVNEFVQELGLRCSSLEQLIMTSQDGVSFDIYRDQLKDGLKTFIYEARMPLADTIIYDLVTQSASTLEHLKLARVFGSDTQRGLALGTEYVQLCNLEIDAADGLLMPFMQPVHGFLSTCCKTLGTLKLSNICLTDRIFDAVLDLPALHTLTLNGGDDPGSALLRFILGAAGQGGRCALKRFTICSVSWMMRVFCTVGMVLPAIGHMRALTHLSLDEFQDQVTHQDVMHFVRNARVSGLADNLEELEICADEDIISALTDNLPSTDVKRLIPCA